MEFNNYLSNINEIDTSKNILNLNISKEEFTKNLEKKYNSSQHIVKSQIIDELFLQDNIKYLIKYLKIDNTKNKPILINKKEFKDPFAPPLFEDMIVSENFCDLNEHRILFTKFPLFKNQVLIVSREFKSQYTHLEKENFRDLIILLNLIDGFGFFNGGEKAGASQPRKHLQAAPFGSLPEKNIGIFNYIKNEEDNLEKINLENKYFKCFYIKKLKNVELNHILFKFEDELKDIFKNINQSENVAKMLLNMSKIGLKFVGIDEKCDKINSDYSLLLTNEFMFITKRKEHDVFINEEAKKKGEIINLNSIAFFFIIVSRSSEQINEMKNGNIIKDVLSKL